MKTREPVLVRGRDTWDRVNLPESVFRSRITSVREMIAERDLNVVLVYGRGDRDGHLCYVSNLVNKVPNWGLLVAITPDSVQLRNERSSRTRPVLERGTWISELEFVDSVVENVHDLFDADAPARIGIVGMNFMPYRQYEVFLEQVADDVVIDVEEDFWEMRNTKSDRERDQIGRAGRILQDVHEFVTESIQTPVTELDLSHQADRIGRLRGMRDMRVLIGNGEHTEPDLRPAEDRPIPADASVVLYTAGRFEGYWAARARTYRFNSAGGEDVRDEQEEKAYREALRNIPIEGTVADLAQALSSIATDQGETLAEGYDLGHGIGLDPIEPPVLDASTNLAIEPGMVFTVHFVLESGQIGYQTRTDTVGITSDGPQVFTY